ncbi:mannosyltransferase [Halobacteriales archaeon QS_1_68_17]|nr:MAG: mannosyltransferase [Halobacteriales archaeon QS_1_68_17]
MNLLHVSKFYYPKVGGIEWVVRQLAKGMTGPGNTVRVLSSVSRGFGGRQTINGVRVSKAASAGVLLSVPLAPTFPLHLRAASRDADLVHYHLPDPLSVTSHQLAASTDARIVATYHNDIVRQSTPLKLYRPVLDRFLDRTDRILVTSPALRDRSDFLAPYTEKCTVVPLSIDLDEYEPGIPPASDLPVSGDRPVVLFVGRLIYYKGVEYLVDAMAQVDADLLVVGDGERRESFERRAEDQGVGDRVSFLGYVSDETLHHCYDRADVFVLPSVAPSEGFGIVQLEAMAYRTPVVNTDIPSGVPWVSRDGETGLTVPPEDPDSLAAAIETLLADQSLRREYGENARQRVEERFSRDRMVRETRAVYEELFGS